VQLVQHGIAKGHFVCVLPRDLSKKAPSETSHLKLQDTLTVGVGRVQGDVEVSSWLSGMLRALTGGWLADYWRGLWRLGSSRLWLAPIIVEVPNTSTVYQDGESSGDSYNHSGRQTHYYSGATVH
jgi:hypothetical protein